MNRRDFVHMGLAGGGIATVAGRARAAPASAGPRQATAQAGVLQLQAEMAAGRHTAASLVALYQSRIRALDRSGPRLNAVIELNPDAAAIAAALDTERRAKGARGPLHGIPVLLKDNIASADRMRTSAGSLALAHAPAARDAHIVQRLRAAGAVILGKTNLSEWANLRSTRSTSGWSARGGLTRNPYALDRNTSGSSSGTGAAIAAALAAIGVGTETDGSIVSPASVCGLVGIKPSLGLVSRSGIIPLAHSQDTAGPMARSVSDAALLLQVLAGPDPSDSITVAGAARVPDYAAALDRTGLKGARIGVARNFFGNNDELDAIIEAALKDLAAQGAVLVDPVEVPNTAKYADSELEVLLFEFKADLPRYLAAYAPGAPIANMADLIGFNLQHREQELQFFGQEFLLRAQAKGGLDSEAYRTALANNQRYSRAEGLDQVLQEHRLDALVAPTGSPAWISDFINGDHSGNGCSSPAAVAGYPHITVPAGLLHGLPVGLSFFGAAFSETTLLRLAYGYEQATLRRRAPTYPPSVSLRAK